MSTTEDTTVLALHHRLRMANEGSPRPLLVDQFEEIPAKEALRLLEITDTALGSSEFFVNAKRGEVYLFTSNGNLHNKLRYNFPVPHNYLIIHSLVKNFYTYTFFHSKIFPVVAQSHLCNHRYIPYWSTHIKPLKDDGMRYGSRVTLLQRVLLHEFDDQPAQNTTEPCVSLKETTAKPVFPLWENSLSNKNA